jgi:hypothetical protein
MSRRHRGRSHHHAPAGADGPRRTASAGPAGSAAPEATPRTAAAAPPRVEHQAPPRIAEARPEPPADAQINPSVGVHEVRQPSHPVGPNGAPAEPGFTTPAPSEPAGGHQNGDRLGQCTAPQLRRFIKSRPYVPMHELRRRFGINGDDDDVTPVRLNPGWVYVGLPTYEGHLLGELLRTGEIGYELSLDPRTPIVIGVYPMRPIPRT